MTNLRLQLVPCMTYKSFGQYYVIKLTASENFRLRIKNLRTLKNIEKDNSNMGESTKKTKVCRVH